MKYQLLLAALFAMGIFSVSCTKQAVFTNPYPDGDGFSTLTVNVRSGHAPASRAIEAYVDEADYEKAIKNLQILVFDKLNNLVAYKNCGTSTTGQSFTLPYGQMTVYAVANGPDVSGVKKISELTAVATDLSENSRTGGFIMIGSGTVNLNSASASVSVSVARLVSRIALVSVTNNLPGSYESVAVEIKNVFLANVVGGYSLGRARAGSVWYNQEARKDESPRVESHIIDGATYLASVPELTFAAKNLSIDAASTTDFDSSPLLLYAYPNGSTVDPSGFHSSFVEQKTAIVVSVLIGGQQYYYPVVMNSLEPNTAYTVALTLKALGSTEPGGTISKGSISASITVAGWGKGATYDETI